jgi:hypothetical protein
MEAASVQDFIDDWNKTGDYAEEVYIYTWKRGDYYILRKVLI